MRINLNALNLKAVNELSQKLEKEGYKVDGISFNPLLRCYELKYLKVR